MRVNGFYLPGEHAEATTGYSDKEDVSSPNIQVDMSADGEMLFPTSAKRLRNRFFQCVVSSYEVLSRGEHLIAHEFLVICARVLSSEAFELGITFMVCISCVSLALDNPLNDPNSNVVFWLYYVDLVVTIVFALEFAMKVLVFGAVHKRTEHNAYFRDGNTAAFFS